MVRHGAESHYLRADGVHISSILQPSIGYDPVGDAQAVGASFVTSGGLAGPVATAHRLGGSVNLLGAPVNLLGRHHRLRGSVNLLGAPINLLGRHRLGALPTGVGLKAWWMGFKARVKANLQVNRAIQQMRLAPPLVVAMPMVAPEITVDTSPRAENADPTALAVQGGWAPAPQTPSGAASLVYAAAVGDPPDQSAGVTAMAMAPAEAGWASDFWARDIYGNYEPVIASRMQNNALRRWYGGGG